MVVLSLQARLFGAQRFSRLEDGLFYAPRPAPQIYGGTMAGDFDPYYRWLGIPREEQPANYYRLLGLKVFEQDPEVIQTAADRQMAHLRTFQSGEHLGECQRMLNEVSGARLALLHPKKKSAYDALLRRKMEEKAAADSSESVLDPALDELFHAAEADLLNSGVHRHHVHHGHNTARGPDSHGRDRNDGPESDGIAGRSWMTIGGVLLVALAFPILLYFVFFASGPTEGPPIASSGVFGPAEPATEVPHSSSDVPKGADHGGSRETKRNDGSAHEERLGSAREHRSGSIETGHAGPESPLGPAMAVPSSPIGADDGSFSNLIANPWYDVLPAVQTSRDVAKGLWIAVDDRMAVEPGDQSLLTLPVRCTGSYTLEAEFVYQAGSGGLRFVLPVGDRACCVVFGGADGATFGLEMVGGESVESNPTHRRIESVEWDGPHLACFEIVPLGSEAHIRVSMDAETLFRWSGPREALSLDAKFPVSKRNQPALIAHQVRLIFGGVRVRGKTPEAVAWARAIDQPAPPGLDRHVSGAESATDEREKLDQAILESVGSSDTSSSSDHPAGREEDRTAEEAPQSSRLPIPGNEAQQRLRAQIDEVFRVSSATDPADQAALARQLLESGKKQWVESAERYVLLCEAAKLGERASDLALVMEAVRSIGQHFAVDRLELQSDALVAFSEDTSTPRRVQDLFGEANRLIGEATQADRYDLAQRMATRLYRIACKGHGRKYRKQCSELRAEVQRRSEEFKAVRDAQAKLEQQANAADAHLVVGRWLCLRKDDWQAGLPHLTRGADDELKAVAIREMRSRPTEPTDQIELADAWWEIYRRANERDRIALARHAAHWYRLAKGRLGSIVLNTKVSTRLKTLEEDLAASVDKPEVVSAVDGSFPQGQWIEILSRCEPGRHTVDGRWERQDGELVVAEPGDTSRIMMPVLVAGSYAVRVGFTRKTEQRDVAVILPVAERAVNLHLSAGEGKVSALTRVGGKGTSENPSARFPGTLNNNQRYDLEVRVRLEGDMVSIEALLDGEPYLRWAGPAALLTPPNCWELPDLRCVGLAARMNVTHFHYLQIKSIDGGIEWADEPGAAPLPPREIGSPTTLTAAGPMLPRGKWIDVLDKVCLDEDHVRGAWRFCGDQVIRYGREEASRIMLPVVVGGDYDLRIEFTRVSANGPVRIVVPVEGTHCCVSLGSRDGEFHSLSLIDGKEPEIGPAVRRPGQLSNGDRYLLEMAVRTAKDQAQIRVLLNGKPLVAWSGPIESLSVGGSWNLPHLRRPALAAVKGQVAFHTTYLRPVSGKTNWLRP